MSALGVSGPGGCLVLGGVWFWGVSAPKGCLLPEGVWSGGPGGDPPRTVTAAGGTHPTGMHSCFYLFLRN